MQKITICVALCIVCFGVGLGLGEVRRIKADRSYRERLAIYIAEVERIRELYSALEGTNQELRAELERSEGYLEAARSIIDGFEQTTSGSIGGIRRALEGLQALRDLIEALEGAK